MYGLWDDMYDTEEKTDKFVSGVTNISYFNGVWRESCKCQYRRTDCSETGVHLCIRQQWWEQRSALDVRKQNYEIPIAFILESHHIHGMKWNKHLWEKNIHFDITVCSLQCSPEWKSYLDFEISLAVDLSNSSAIPCRYIDVSET